MSNVVIRVSVRTNRVGSEVVDEVDSGYLKEEWDALTPGERAEILEEYTLNHMATVVDAWAEVLT